MIITNKDRHLASGNCQSKVSFLSKAIFQNWNKRFRKCLHQISLYFGASKNLWTWYVDILLRYFCNFTLFVFEKRKCNHRINTFDTIAQTKRTLKHYDNFFADWNPEMPYFHSMAKSKFLYVSFKKYSKQSTTWNFKLGNYEARKFNSYRVRAYLST